MLIQEKSPAGPLDLSWKSQEISGFHGAAGGNVLLGPGSAIRLCVNASRDVSRDVPCYNLKDWNARNS